MVVELRDRAADMVGGVAGEHRRRCAGDPLSEAIMRAAGAGLQAGRRRAHGAQGRRRRRRRRTPSSARRYSPRCAEPGSRIPLHVATTPGSPSAHVRAGPRTCRRRPGRLVVGAVGVVFGDIGTSPLYTIKEMFNPHFGLVPDAATVQGPAVAGLLVADPGGDAEVRAGDHARRQRRRGRHHGPDRAGAAQPASRGSRLSYVVGILGIFGASLFFGDGMITPPITVLGAVEGLAVISPRLATWVVPISAGHPGRPVREPALRHRQGRARCSAR